MSYARSKNVAVGKSARRQVWPPSVVTRNPLSLPLSMNFVFFGSIHIAWLSPPTPRPPPPPAGGAPAAGGAPPTGGGVALAAAGCGPTKRANVLPPSRDTLTPSA